MQSKTRVESHSPPSFSGSFLNPNFSSSRVQKIELSFQIFTGSSNHKMLREDLPSRARGLFLWRYNSKPRKLGPWWRLPGPWKSVEVQLRLLSCPAFPHICVAAKSSRLQWWASRDHLPASIIKEEWDDMEEMKTSILFPLVVSTVVENGSKCRIFPTILSILSFKIIHQH